MITLKLAWRNILRQKARTGLTVAAITFCTFSVFLTMAMAHGMHQQMIDQSVSVFSGHFQIQAEGYLNDPTLDKAFKPPEKVLQDLDNDKRVKGVAPRVTSGGLVSTDDKTAGGIIVGVDPAREAKATKLITNVREGVTLKPGDEKKVLLGKTLAENIEIKPGDEIQLMIQSFYGSLELGFFEVAGTVTTGSPDFDQSIVIMPLKDAQYLFEMDGMVTDIPVILYSDKDRLPVMDMVQKGLAEAGGDKKLIAVPWEDLLPQLVEFLFLDNAGAVLYLVILVVVVAFIVLLTITMSVMERVREFGVLLAIGTRPRRIFYMIMIECFIIGVIGTALGILITTPLAMYFHAYPLDMSSMAEAYEQFGINPQMTTMLNAAIFWGTALIMISITVLSSLLPAFRAVRIKPVDAMRHV